MRLYQERVHIEELFRNLKSHFGLERMTLRSRKSKENLTSVLFATYTPLCHVD